MTGPRGLMNDTAKMWKSIDEVDKQSKKLELLASKIELQKILVKHIGPGPNGSTKTEDGRLIRPWDQPEYVAAKRALDAKEADLAKRAAAPKPLDPVPFDRPPTRKAMAEIEKIMADALAKLGESAAKAVQAKLNTGAAKTVATREIPTIDYGYGNTLRKAWAGCDILRKDAATIGAILASIDWGLLLSTAKATGNALQAVAQDAALRSLESLDTASTPDLIRRVGAAAKAQADALVQTLIDGTESMLTQMLETAIAVGGTAAAIAGALRASRIFSKDRAATIALTETVNANGIGALEAFKEASAMKEWVTAGDEDVDSVCLINEAAGPIAVDAVFPSGHAAPGAHPNCRCVIRPVIEA